MSLLKFHYKFGNEWVTPKDTILIVVSAVISAITSSLLFFGIQKLGFSLVNIALIIMGIITLMPFIIFFLMTVIHQFLFKD